MQSFHKLGAVCKLPNHRGLEGGVGVQRWELCALGRDLGILNGIWTTQGPGWNHVLFWYCDKHVRTRSREPVKDLSHTHILVSGETLELKAEPRQESLKNLWRNSGASATDRQALPVLHKGFACMLSSLFGSVSSSSPTKYSSFPSTVADFEQDREKLGLLHQASGFSAFGYLSLKKWQHPVTSPVFK